MTIEIKAPTLPESVPDGTIATWHKKAGDAVKRDELLVDIETDKVVIEVVSPADGVLQRIIKNTGDTIVSNELIAHVEEGATEAAPVSPASATKEEVAMGEEPMLSPAAKKIAEENAISIESIKGSGKNGRVTKEDVLEAVARKGAAPAAAPTVAVAGSAAYANLTCLLVA